MKGKHYIVALLALGIAPAAAAQDHGVAAPCYRTEVPAQARDVCLTVAQAVQSAQPQLGILLAGGNPTLGAASAGGLRLGILPRVSGSAKANLVMVRLPEILAEQAGSTFQRLNEATGVPAPALSLTASVGVFPGVTIAPLIGGIGAVDLLGTASWLPLRTFDIGGFQEGTDDFSFGLGARLGLVRESFVLPGASISLMRHRVSRLAYGEVCPSPVAGLTETSSEYTLVAGFCGTSGDPGEFAFDLTNWSTRAVVSKRLLGFGLTGGVGRDSYSSDIDFGFRSARGASPVRRTSTSRRAESRSTTPAGPIS